jgi:hypothetical protein
MDIKTDKGFYYSKQEMKGKTEKNRKGDDCTQPGLERTQVTF